MTSDGHVPELHMTGVSSVCRQCRVVRLERFGVFVEIAPGKDGLVHQSELDLKSVRNVADQFAEGDLLDVMLLEVQETGKLSLSRWVAGRPQIQAKKTVYTNRYPESRW